MQRRKRYKALDIFRAVGSFLVVLLHARVIYWTKWDSPRWMAENVISAVGLMAVPIFLMISGGMLLGYPDRYSTGHYVKNRFMKVFVPACFGAVVSLVWAVLVGNYKIHSFRDFCAGFYSVDVNRTYWYLRAQIAQYMVFPVIALSLQGRSDRFCKRMLDYLIALSLLSAVIIPFFRLYDSRFLAFFTLSIGPGFLIYSLIGYRLIRFPLSRRGGLILGVMALIGACLFLFATPAISAGKKTLDLRFADYLTMPVVAMASFCFWILAHPGLERRIPKKLVKRMKPISDLSFPIYLLHYPVLASLDMILEGLGVADLGGLLFILIRAITAFALTVLCCQLLRKNEFVRKYLLP